MTETNVESRLDKLEQKVHEILERIRQSEPANGSRQNWRESLGMFTDRPEMKRIDKAGNQLRENERQQVADDHS